MSLLSILQHLIAIGRFKYRVDFKMPLMLYLALFLLLLTMPLVTHGVLPSSCSTTEWKLPDAKKNAIPNFSRVGYREGNAMIPMIPVMKTLKPSPDSSVDDTYRIQAAIDEVGNLPLQSFGRDDIQVRGAVLLTNGVYHIGGVLVIHKSGVVLRGEGPDPKGTTLLASRRSQGDFIQINGGLSSNDPRRNARGPEYSQSMNDYNSPSKAQTKTRKDSYIPVGTATLPVENTRGFKVGDKIVVEWSGSEEWVKDIGMDRLLSSSDANNYISWYPRMFEFRFERTILVINEDERTFTVDIPMTMNVDPKYHSARIFQPAYKLKMISDVGIENLRLSRTGSKEQPSTLHAVQIDNTIHGWVSDVSTDGFMLGIETTKWTRFITIQNCHVDCQGGDWAKPDGMRIGFDLSGQMGLMNNCTTVGAFYDFTSVGPSCDSRSINSVHRTGPLKRWVTGSLYDNVVADNFDLGLSDGEPGWTGAFDVFYNCKAEKRDSNFESAPGTTNWIIGYQGHLPEDYFERKSASIRHGPFQVSRGPQDTTKALLHAIPIVLTMTLVTLGVFPPSYSTAEWKLLDPNNNTIPNFSRIGYREGHVRIPIFPVMITLNLSLNSSVDDTARVQRAIDDVGNLPLQSFGGDGIKFWGQRRVFILNYSGLSSSDTSALAQIASENSVPGELRTETREGSNIPVGTTTLPWWKILLVSKVGDKIVVEWSGSEEWIKDIGMDRLLSSSDANKYISWYPMMFKFRFERTILAINEDERTFTVDILMVMNVDPKYPPHSAKIYRHSYNVALISDVGVENLRLFKKSGQKKSSSPSRPCMRFMTIQNCHVDCKGGNWAKPDGMRTGFVLGWQLSLVNNCTTVGAFHDFASGGHTFGPLQLWATGTLFGNILSGDFGLSNRSLSGLRPCWAGAFNVFYSCKAERRASYFESAPGTNNRIIGAGYQ
ncbi:hypothetical protein KVV02_007737 [Mortierella alpina]|uniref:Uncharacterized protein n=1 Tax=Mortierella alpina TaxID=64518 RepID=A0A9P8A7J8_MORAP|nr:hypothetical protein KVV02_007737 [Mortierella alpina]